MPLRNTILVDKEGNQLAPATTADQVSFSEGQNWQQYMNERVDQKVGYIENDVEELAETIDGINLNIISQEIIGSFSNGKATIPDRSGYILAAAYPFERSDSEYGITDWSRQENGSYVVSNKNSTLSATIKLQLVWIELQNSVANKRLTTRTVSASGTANYTSITAAVESAYNDDVIIVYPGVYEESINALSKRVHIIGTSKEKCILTYSGLNYAKPPLEMAKGSVRNMTIIATNSGTAGTARAYCVHIDNNNSANEGLSFINCDFINEVHQAVGISLRANFTLEFVDCIFKAEDAAALYCHDWETSDTSADKTGQKLIVRNCALINNSASNTTILLQSQELVDGGAEAVFIGNSVANKGGGELISMYLWQGRTLTNENFMGSSDWILSDSSAMNSTDAINKILTVIPAEVAALSEDVTALSEDVTELREDLGYTRDVEYTLADGYFNADGTISSASANAKEKYTENYISVISGEVIHVNWNGDQYDRAIWIAYMLYDATKAVLGTRTVLYSGSGQTYSGSVTIPDNAAFIRFSWRSFGFFMLDISRGTLYENVKQMIANTQNTIIVATDGTGDYTTITEAAQASHDGDTIFIKDGTYYESVKINGRKLHLVGESRDGTILKYLGTQYANPPLEMSHGSIENMTIWAISEEGATGGGGYCLHCDNSASANNYLICRNVKFQNDYYQVIGIGLEPNFTIRFENCEFIGQIYCHDCAREFADLTGQRFEMIDCAVHAKNQPLGAIRMQSQEREGAEATALFQRCIVKNDNQTRIVYMGLWDSGETLPKDKWLGSSDWTLDGMSTLNNQTVLDA